MLVSGVRRFTEVDFNIFQVCNVHAHEGILRETAKQQRVNLTSTLVTCIGCVQAKGRRACAYGDFLSDGAFPTAFSLTLPAPGKSRLLGRLCT